MINYNDQVTLMIADHTKHDDYGRPLVVEHTTKGHVRYKQSNIYNEKGEYTSSDAIVYIPYNSNKMINIDERPRILVETPNGRVEFTRTIRIEYGQTVTGRPVFIKFYVGS